MKKSYLVVYEAGENNLSGFDPDGVTHCVVEWLEVKLPQYEFQAIA